MDQDVWNVQLTIDGGLPTGSDRVIFGTPGTNTVLYTPTGADAGTLTLDQATDSVTTLAGIEHLIYDGEGGNDTFTIVGTAAADTSRTRPAPAQMKARCGATTRWPSATRIWALAPR